MPASRSLFNGDANGDNSVNIQDFLILRAAFGAAPGSPNWDVRADLNRSGTVNVQDFLILRRSFGQSGNYGSKRDDLGFRRVRLTL